MNRRRYRVRLSGELAGGKEALKTFSFFSYVRVGKSDATVFPHPLFSTIRQKTVLVFLISHSKVCIHPHAANAKEGKRLVIPFVHSLVSLSYTSTVDRPVWNRGKAVYFIRIFFHYVKKIILYSAQNVFARTKVCVLPCRINLVLFHKIRHGKSG